MKVKTDKEEIKTMNQIKRNLTLTKFLNDVDARMIKKIKDGKDNFLEFYLANNKPFVVRYFSLDDGWDIYIPACLENSVQRIFDKVKEYLEN